MFQKCLILFLFVSSVWAQIPSTNSELQQKLCVGLDHSCSLSIEGKVRCWGDNTYGQLGYGDTIKRGDGAREMGSNLPYVDLGTQIPISIRCGYFHTCVRFENLQIKCWGRNNYGQLGYGDTENRGDEPGEMGSALSFVILASDNVPRTAELVSAGRHFTCAILNTRNVKCWGRNNHGQLGIGSTTTLLAPPSNTIDIDQPGAIQQISAGESHVCARPSSSNRPAICWGNNDVGQLGLGDTNNRGDEPGEMGVAISLVALGRDQEVTQIQAGPGISCARLADQTVKCWGLNDFGQLGYATDTLNQNIGDEPGEMGDDLASVDFGTGAANVRWMALGRSFSCVHFADGRLKCYGNYSESSPPNDNGAYIDIGTGNLVDILRMKMNHGCIINVIGHVKCFGENDHGQLGQGNTVDKYIFSQLGDTFPFINFQTLSMTSPPTESTTSPENNPIGIIIGVIIGILVFFVMVRYLLYGNLFGFIDTSSGNKKNKMPEFI